MNYRNAEIAVYGILVVGLLAIMILGILGHVQITLVVLLITIFLVLIVCCSAQAKHITQMCSDEDSCEKANPSGSSNRFSDIALPSNRFSDIALPSAPESAVNLSVGTASGICKIKVDDPRIFISAMNDSSETITIGDDRSSTIIVKDAIEWINFENIGKEGATS